MENTLITFDQLPAFVVDLGRKVDDLTALLRSQSERGHSIPDRWFSIEELSEYLPGHPAVTTLYGKVQRREIPFSRKGKRLAFRQSDIDLWLQSGRVKTSAEIDAQAEHYLSNQRKGGRKAR
ncbi:helix-turn-helix domain-containing protein [Spirosoma fluviale]|uniref:Helix-turn-helix domain-containing protein n=1 Tax=Spirosoma fluviale TaxID=1597977 RepID=A0A286GSW1_9BACT|nr:helix-turn-helix domain-containing protein [Spirosoma fluviale]SOD98054.1 Helix-turn-helix domain-containing protein [Spirosoma fluviale]